MVRRRASRSTARASVTRTERAHKNPAEGRSESARYQARIEFARMERGALGEKGMQASAVKPL